MVIGVLLAYLPGRFASGGFGFSFAILAGVWGTGLVFLLLGLAFLLFFRQSGSATVVDHYFMASILPISRSVADENFLAIAITEHRVHTDGGGEIQLCHNPCVY